MSTLSTDATVLSTTSGNSKWPVIILIISTLAVMGPICSHDFLWWDDQGTIHQNALVNHPSWKSIAAYWTGSQFGLYLPVTGNAWIALAWLARVRPDNLGVALNPWFFHSASVLAHVIASLLVFRILRALCVSPWVACGGTLVFAIHPVQVETVAWASGLKDVLAGMFGFAAILQYIRSAIRFQRSESWTAQYARSLLFFALAILSKGSAISLPLALIAIDRWCIGRSWHAIASSIWPWIVTAIPFGVLVVFIQAPVNTPVQPLWFRPLIACDALSFYLYKLVWPTRLAVEYGRNPASIVAHGWVWWDWVFPLALGVFLWMGRRKRPMLLAAGVVFIGGCLTTLGFTATLYQYFTTVADHYVYAAMLGPAMAAAWLLSIYPSLLLRTGLIFILAVWGIISSHQVGFWQNDYTLFHHAIAVNPYSYVAYGNLGSAYARDGDSKEATVIFGKAIDANPEYALSYSNLGYAQFELGDYEKAMKTDLKAIALQRKYPTLRPTWARDNKVVGEILIREHQYAAAEKYVLEALMMTPGNAELQSDWITLHRLATQPATSAQPATSIPSAMPTTTAAY